MNVHVTVGGGGWKLNRRSRVMLVVKGSRPHESMCDSREERGKRKRERREKREERRGVEQDSRCELKQMGFWGKGSRVTVEMQSVCIMYAVKLDAA